MRKLFTDLDPKELSPREGVKDYHREVKDPGIYWGFWLMLGLCVAAFCALAFVFWRM